MSPDSHQTLADAFERFEHHQFPGYPDAPELQQVYEELVEKGGQLTALIQQVLTGGTIAADQIPTFDAPLPDQPLDPELVEFVSYRGEIDLLRNLLQDATHPTSPP